MSGSQERKRLRAGTCRRSSTGESTRAGSTLTPIHRCSGHGGLGASSPGRAPRFVVPCQIAIRSCVAIARRAPPPQFASLRRGPSWGLIRRSSSIRVVETCACLGVCLIKFVHRLRQTLLVRPHIAPLVEVQFPQATVISVVLDNLNTHTPAALYATFAPAEACRILRKLDFHYTPR
jgi:hypothetical protein